MTTWSNVPAISTSYSVTASASSSFSVASSTSVTFTDISDLSGYVDPGYVVPDYISGEGIWTAVAPVSSSWVPA